ncbi:MAG TPA: hypothetical protein VIC85_17985 [Ktedonobacterales bacterium]|jgi:hypothetical protein
MTSRPGNVLSKARIEMPRIDRDHTGPRGPTFYDAAAALSE